MESKIYFIRHGITEGNQKHWYYGASDIPLADEGIENLREIASKNLYPKDEDVEYYTSGLIRTEQTMELLFGKREHKVIESLREMNFGDFECLSYEELKDNEEFTLWVNDENGDVGIPGGESKNDFAKRIEKGVSELVAFHRLKELSHRHSGKAAISVMVCHGGVTAMAIKTLFPENENSWWDLIPPPAGSYVVDFKDGKPMGFQLIKA